LYDAEFNIINSITDETILMAVNGLKTAKLIEHVLIHLPFNNGGSASAAFALVEAIQKTKATVTIEVDRYVISAAAFVFLWFTVFREDHVFPQTTQNCDNQLAPPIIVYHRPRLCYEGNIIVFLDDLDEKDKRYVGLKSATDRFDELFDALVAMGGYDPALLPEDGEPLTELQHAVAGYYNNYDFITTY
jgi:hypothetical protein